MFYNGTKVINLIYLQKNYMEICYKGTKYYIM